MALMTSTSAVESADHSEAWTAIDGYFKISLLTEF